MARSRVGSKRKACIAIEPDILLIIAAETCCGGNGVHAVAALKSQYLDACESGSPNRAKLCDEALRRKLAEIALGHCYLRII